MVVHTALGSLEVEDLLVGPRCPQARFLARSNLPADGAWVYGELYPGGLPPGVSMPCSRCNMPALRCRVTHHVYLHRVFGAHTVALAAGALLVQTDHAELLTEGQNNLALAYMAGKGTLAFKKL